MCYDGFVVGVLLVFFFCSDGKFLVYVVLGLDVLLVLLRWHLVCMLVSFVGRRASVLG